MPCQKISPIPLFDFSRNEDRFDSLLNLQPRSQPKAVPQDYYLCDRAEDRPQLAKSYLGGKSLAALPSAQLFAPKIASGPALPPPPDTPLAKLLYDLTTQLKDFELSADLKLPMKGIGPGEVETFTHAVMQGQGALINLGIEFKPYAGPQSLLKPFDQVPILGPFFIVRILKVEMNPQSRKLEAKVQYLWFPVNKDVHADYLEKAELAPELIQGKGWNLHQGFPVYSWQILDLILKIVEKRDQTAKKVGIDQVKPVLERGEISISGDFSNEKIQLGGLTLHFAALAPGEEHRLTVSGSLLEPKVKVHGLKAAEWSGKEGGLKLSNADERLDPLEIQLRFDPLGQRATTYEIPSYRSKRMILEGKAAKDGSNLRLDLEEGIEVQGLKFQSDPQGPRIGIEKLTARRLSFQEKGIELRTNPNDAAVFSNVDLRILDGRIHFASQLIGKASGELKVKSGEDEIGFLKFESLQGMGKLAINPAANGDPVVDLSGSLRAQIPELRLMVQSEKLKASVRTQVKAASVSGLGRLRVWPATQQALLQGGNRNDSIRIQGKGGLVTFHQDPSEVEEWPDLKKKLGPAMAKQVRTDFYIEPQDIEFKVGTMEMGRVSAEQGQAALEITKADLGPIRITGDVWGKLFARLPGGLYFPLAIPESAKMKGASVQIGRLQDLRNSQGRDVTFEKVVIAGEESQATFSPKDQKRCGIDRQHIHASLGLFQFSPEDREIQIKDIDPHFHIYVKNLISGGCLKIE